MSSAVTVVTASAALALVGSFLAAGLLPEDASPPAALASASPTSSSAPSAAPTASATPLEDATTHQALTRTFVEFQDGTDPTELVRSEDGLLYYLDRATGTVSMVDIDGYSTRAVGESDVPEYAEPDHPSLGTPRRLATGDTFLLTVDGDGSLWAWDQQTTEELLRHPVTDSEHNWVGWITIDPDTPAMAAYTRGYEDYDLFVLASDVGQVVRYRMEAKTSHFLPAKGMLRRPYDEVTQAVDMHADPGIYALLPSAVLRFSSGLLDEFSIEAPSGETDFRFLDGTGSKKDGRLYVYDAAGGRILEYAKSDGRLISEWATGPEQPSMDDVRGMVVVEGAKGKPSTVAWMTPDGLFESVLSTDPADAPQPDAGNLDPEEVSDPAASGSAGIPETTRSIRSLIRSLEDLRSEPEASKTAQAEMQGLVSDIAALQQVIERLSQASPADAGAKAIDWQTPAYGFEADRLRIRANGLNFKGIEAPFVSYWAGGDRGEYNSAWREHDRAMRLWFFVEADDTHWWVTEIYTYDGEKNGEWLYYKRLAPLTRTPRGQSLEMDLQLTPDEANRKGAKKGASLRIDGMRLTAFAPGTNPAPLEVTGCQPVPRDAAVLVEVEDSYSRTRTGTSDQVEALDYFAEGTLLDGIDLLPREEASTRLSELGICHYFEYHYDFIDPKKDRGIGTSERWCTMPDVARLRELDPERQPIVTASGQLWRGQMTVRDEGYVRITVEDLEPRERREQPPAGWDCPTY